MVDAIVILHAAHCVVVCNSIVCNAIYVLYVILEHYNVISRES